jgi:hypothetical protein
VRHSLDGWKASFAEHQASWQQEHIEADAGRKSEHQKTHERFNPHGAAIEAAMKGKEQ